jgi:hypothetical protein
MAAQLGSGKAARTDESYWGHLSAVLKAALKAAVWVARTVYLWAACSVDLTAATWAGQSRGHLWAA